MSWKMGAEDGEAMWAITERKMNESGNQSNNIAVVVRVRPFNQREKVDKQVFPLVVIHAM